MKVQTPLCPGLWPQSICYQLFENTAKKEACFSLIIQSSSFTATHMAALYKRQPGCAGGKAFERNGIIKELLSGKFFLLLLFLFSEFGSRVPSCIALLLPDSIFPLGFFMVLIAGHNNQLKKKESWDFSGCFSSQESNSSHCLICRHQLEASVARQSSGVFPARRWREHL